MASENAILTASLFEVNQDASISKISPIFIFGSNKCDPCHPMSSKMNMYISRLIYIYACWSSMTWVTLFPTESTLVFFSVAINGNHIVEDEHAYISRLK